MKYFFALLITGLIMSGSSFSKNNNPLLDDFNTPYNVPPFDKIKTEHFEPAIKEAIKLHEAEINAITSNKEKPTFKNTVEALEYSGAKLNEINTILSNLSSANTSEELQTVNQNVTPWLSKHYDEITLNEKLFLRIKAVYDQRNSLGLNTEQMQLLKETYKSFTKNGANLDPAHKEMLKKVNLELPTLELQFGDNLLAETNAFKLVIDKQEDLAGLPQSIIDGAAAAAKSAKMEGKWLFTLHNPSIMPFLQYSSNRELRRKIQQAYINRCDNNNANDNKSIITKIINLRLEKAKLLGYKNYGEYELDGCMAQNPDNAMKLMMQIWKPAVKVAQKEADALQNMINREGNNFKLEAWDWRYYAEKLRKEKYDMDEEALRPYFQVDNVREGVFTLSNKLYGLTFKVRNDIPKYNPDCVVYEVIDNDGSTLAILYMDFFSRSNKRGGAWMTNFREQYKKDGKNIIPVISLVMNFPKPTAASPSLLTFDDAETLFHEFGHSLQGMLSKCTYRSISGTNVSRDFVEMPSQIMENWVSEPAVLKLFAKHYKTGEVIPDELITKIKNSALFNQGFGTVELTAAAILDMTYHTMNSPMTTPLSEFESKELKSIGLIPEIIVRYRTTYFNHIWAGGYSAGYYSYLWAGVLDADAFELFKEKGIFDKATATSFRKNILEKGKTEDEMILYKRFRGAEPSIQPYLKRRGLL